MLGSGGYKPVRGSSLRSPKQTSFSQSFPSRPKQSDAQHRDGKVESQPRTQASNDPGKRAELLKNSGETAVAAFVPVSPLTAMEREQMKFEDLRSAYLRLEESSEKRISSLESQCSKLSQAAKSGRERAMLTQKLESLNRLCSDSSDTASLKHQFEEVAIAYWLLANGEGAVSPSLQVYVKSLLQGGSETLGSTDPDQARRLLEQVARLRKDLTAKDLANTMCTVQVNKLSATMASLLGEELPTIQKYPELELPEVCKALTVAVSKVVKEGGRDKTPISRVRTPAPARVDWKSPASATQPINRSLELQLEEVMFERDLARKQNSILQEVSKAQMSDERRLAVFERLYQKEEGVRAMTEALREEKAALVQDKTEFEETVKRYRSEVDSLRSAKLQLEGILSVAKTDSAAMTVQPTTRDQYVLTEQPTVLTKETDTASLHPLKDSAIDPIPVITTSLATMTDPPAVLSKKVNTEAAAFTATKGVWTEQFRTVNRGVDPMHIDRREQGSMTAEQGVTENSLSMSKDEPRAFESPAKVRRYRDSALRRAVTSRTAASHASTIAVAEQVLQTANKHLGAIERIWYNASSKKLKESVEERKGCLTPFEERAMMTPRGRGTPYQDFESHDDWDARSMVPHMGDDLSDVSFGSQANEYSSAATHGRKHSQYSSIRQGDRRHTEAPKPMDEWNALLDEPIIDPHAD